MWILIGIGILFMCFREYFGCNFADQPLDTGIKIFIYDSQDNEIGNYSLLKPKLHYYKLNFYLYPVKE